MGRSQEEILGEEEGSEGVNPAIFQQPFFQVTLPLMFTFVGAIWVASWAQNKRFDDLRADINRRFEEVGRRFDDVIARLTRIEAKLDDHEQRIVRLEERTSPVARR
jgi:hypothetical protein